MEAIEEAAAAVVSEVDTKPYGMSHGL